MTQTYGIDVPEAKRGGPYRAPARYLVKIEPADQSSALLFDAARCPLGEFSAASEEVAVMTQGLTPSRSAGDSVWDASLGQYSAEERAAAEVYQLDL